MNRSILLTMATLLTLGVSAQAADWGDLTATFVFVGKAPTPTPINANKDPEVCANKGLVEEDLVVNSANGGLANVIVSLYVATGGKKPPIHVSYAATEKAEIRVDNHNCRFEPHVVALRTTQTLIAGNKDPAGHNMNITTLKNPPQNILIPGMGSIKLNYQVEETVTTPLACNIHPWMKGYVVIKSHPYVGISDKDGKITIKNVPAGKWKFQFFHEKFANLSKVNVGGKETSWEKGRPDIDIKPGMNDLGTIMINPANYAK